MSEVLTHKCPNCDGPLLFDPSEQTVECPYCLSVCTYTELEDSKADQGSKSNNETLDQKAEEMDLFVCPSCGAEIVTDTTTAATFCFYCHNPVVLKGRISGQYLPDKIVPFAMSKKKALGKFRKWTKGKWFIPEGFFRDSQMEKLSGVYFPYWVFEADLEATLTATATKIKVWRSGDYEYTEKSKYRIFRQGQFNFKELIKNALKKNSSIGIVESVQPFPLEKAVSFNSHYLAGFQAEKRDLELNELENAVSKEFEDHTHEWLHDTLRMYTRTSNKDETITLTEQRADYVLLPVWLLTYHYRGRDKSNQLFYYAMNGYNGKISGKLPLDRKKLRLFCLSVSAGIFLLLLLAHWIGVTFLI